MVASDPAKMGGTWYAETSSAPDPRAPLSLDLDVDVCVVGGGLAGLTVAREIARCGRSVALLEAGRIGGAASGRNTGFVLPGFAADIDGIVARVGVERARSLWDLSVEGAEYVRKLVRDEAVPDVALRRHGWLHVSKTDNGAELSGYAERLSGDFGADVSYWPPERVRDRLKSPLYFGALHYNGAFTINPLAYARGLATSAENAGARLFEDTPVLTVDVDGLRKRVATPSARVRAFELVLAGNVDLGRVAPQFARTLLPITTYVIVTAPLGPALREAIAYRGAVSDTDLADNHYRVLNGNRLMWSGRSTVWRGDPQRQVRPLLNDLARAYPQLGPVEAAYAWSGTLGNTVHRMPQIARVRPGLWLLSGFGGHGLNTTAMGGVLVARGIAGDDDNWRLFETFPLTWAGGAIGRAALQVYAWSYRYREKLQTWLAQHGGRSKQPKLVETSPQSPKPVQLPSREDASEPVREPARESEPAPNSEPAPKSKRAIKPAKRQAAGKSGNRRKAATAKYPESVPAAKANKTAKRPRKRLAEAAPPAEPHSEPAAKRSTSEPT